MLSVILCAHNPKPVYLQRTLDGLRGQTLAREEWELIVVDNRSNTPLADKLDLSWHRRTRLVREETLGITFARLRGIRESCGDMLVFVDDDNVLDANYLEEALRIAEERPYLGSWSGQCKAEFEQPPPEWTRRYWGNLVIREFDADRWSNLPRLAETMPCGAGLCVRREVAQHYLQLYDGGQRSFQLDRMGDSLMSAGDNDLAACACDIGLGVGLVAALKLTHLIPPERLTADYQCRLAEGIHFSSAFLDHIRGLPVPKRSKVRKLLDFLRRIKLREPHRSIQCAVVRGYDRAVAEISRLTKSAA